MKKSLPAEQPNGDLRHQAEQRLLHGDTEHSPPTAVADVLALLHELQVHQIELEMQNEELRRAQLELTTIGARYRDLYDFAPVGYLTLDADGRILEANLAAASLLGIGRRDLLKRRFSSFLSPVSQATYRAFASRLQETTTRQEGEFGLLQSDGTLRYLQVQGTLAAAVQQASRQIRLALLEVTTRKRAELALEQNEAQLEGIIGSAMDAIICVDQAHRIVLFNAAAEQMFCCQATEAFGQPIDRFIPERFRRIHGAHIDAFGRTGATNRSMGSLTPVFGLRADGEEFPIEATISHIEIAESTLYTVIIRDITDRIQAEQTAHRRTTALLQALKAVKTLPELDLFLEQMLATLIQCLNAGAASLWLYDREQDTLSLRLDYENGHYLTGEQMDHAAFSEILSVHANPFWLELVRTQQPLILDLMAETPCVPNHEWLRARGYTNLLIVPLLLGDDLIGCISIRNAATPHYRPAELELAQALAQQATLAIQMTRLAEQGRQSAILQERNRMAQDIHDTLAQGFNGILVQLEAATYAPEPEQMRRHIIQARDLARESLQEARRSVRALRPQILEGERLSGALAHLVRQSATGDSTRTTLEVQGVSFPVPLDVEEHLYRIAQEALNNAIRHSEATEIAVELAFESEQVQLSIRDNGKGFDVQSGFQGNGFGLIGMYERAERIGGHLTLVTAPGQGATVSVTVPTSP